MRPCKPFVTVSPQAATHESIEAEPTGRQLTAGTDPTQVIRPAGIHIPIALGTPTVRFIPAGEPI